MRRTSQHNHPDIITILTWSVSPDKVAGHIECIFSRSVVEEGNQLMGWERRTIGT